MMRMARSASDDLAALSYFLDPFQQGQIGVGYCHLWRGHFVLVRAAQRYGALSINESCKICFFDFCRLESSSSFN